VSRHLRQYLARRKLTLAELSKKSNIASAFKRYQDHFKNKIQPLNRKIPPRAVEAEDERKLDISNVLESR
jgi:hypothetical protein